MFGIIKAYRDKEARERKTLYAVQGIDLDYENYKAKYAEMTKRADAKRQGFTDDDDEDTKLDIFNADSSSLTELGIEIEIEGE